MLTRSASSPPRRRRSGVQRIGSEPEGQGTTIRFAQRSDGSIEAIEIVTRPRSGLFLPLCQALFENGVQIVGSRVLTQPHAVRARFELATEAGGPILREQALDLQSAVLATVVCG